MNYYDELGVRRDAPVQEIRQAYRVLVRLLHPDTQADEELRLAAERQLTRLNSMVAVLSNPELRRAYDRELAGSETRRIVVAPSAPAAAPAVWPHAAAEFAVRRVTFAGLVVRHWSLILIGAVTCGAAVASLLLRNPGDGPAEPRIAEAARGTPAGPPKSQPVASRPAQIVVESAAPVAAPAVATANAGVRLRPAAATPSPAETPPAARSLPPVPAAPAAPTLRIESPPPVAPPAPASTFAGNWFYTTSLDGSGENTGYRAVYVELLLSERGGILAGNYRARYVIPDKAISPQVSFELHGKAGPDRRTKLEWTGANGARGEAEMRVDSSGVMDFHWWSTAIPEKTELSSGSARLVRQRVP